MVSDKIINHSHEPKDPKDNPDKDTDPAEQQPDKKKDPHEYI
jgi:hypothetical protein